MTFDQRTERRVDQGHRAIIVTSVDRRPRRARSARATTVLCGLREIRYLDDVLLSGRSFNRWEPRWTRPDHRPIS